MTIGVAIIGGGAFPRIFNSDPEADKMAPQVSLREKSIL